MSEVVEESKENPSKDNAPASSKDSDKTVDRVYLVPQPNVVFLYPTLIAAILAAIGMSIWGGADAEGGSSIPGVLNALFLWTAAINLFVLTIDFPRVTALTLFFLVSTLLLAIFLLGNFYPDFLPWIRNTTGAIQPSANAAFYWIFAAILLGIQIVARIAVQFDYWEVRRNELLHHHGFLSDLRRYPTEGLQVEKEINDVFEYMLLRSGKLILRPQGGSRDIVLENVAMIGKKEKQITKLLSARKVTIQTR